MAQQRIVARYCDGRVVKGTTTNFSPATPSFLLHPTEGGEPTKVDLDLLKGVFFVRDFAGNPKRKDRDCFVEGQPYQGRAVQVEFQDGEVLLGYTPNYNPAMQGFFVFPADPDSNTIKAFAVMRAVRDVKML